MKHLWVVITFLLFLPKMSIADESTSANYKLNYSYFSGGAGVADASTNYKTKQSLVPFHESCVELASSNYISEAVPGPMNYSIFNSAPYITSVGLMPMKFYDDTNIDIDVFATDDDGDTIEYRFSVNGVEKQAYSSLSSYTYTPEESGETTFKVEVKDLPGAASESSNNYYIYRKPKN